MFGNNFTKYFYHFLRLEVILESVYNIFNT